MATTSELFDQMRDLLNDASDTEVSFATKKLYLNLGIARMWPRIYRLAVQTLTIVAEDITELSVTDLGDGHIVSVEYSDDGDVDNYVPLMRYRVTPGDEDRGATLYMGFVPTIDATVRIVYTKPVPFITAADYAASESETWTGPDRTIGLPVLYAMGMATARKLDDRQDTNAYSTTQALNGVTDQDIMGAAQMWFGQFEAELAELERPLPIARG